MPKPGDLASNRLLALMPLAQRESLAQHFTVCRFAPGQVLQHEGAEIDYLYFPASGIIANTLTVPDAADVTVSIVGREGALFSDGAGPFGRSLVKATVRSGGMAWRMTLPLWRELIAARPASDLVAAYNALCASETQQNAACCLLHDVESRVCRWLLHVQDRLDGAAVAMTHADLASLAGTRRTTVTLITGALESAGIIDNHRSKIEVVDRFALEAAACDCYPAIRTRRDEFELRFASSPDAAHPTGENEGAELSF